MEDFSQLICPAFCALPAWGILLLFTGRTLWRWRHSALKHALVWSMVALAANLLIAVSGMGGNRTFPWRYLGLVAGSCVPISILGARYPGASAWDFVVASFVAMAMLPVLEQPWHSPEWRLDGVWSLLLAIILAVGWLNYLPTRLAWVVTGLAWTGYWQLALIGTKTAREALTGWADWCSTAGLWWAAVSGAVVTRQRRIEICNDGAPRLGISTSGSTCTDWGILQQLWREIRDGWGLVWAWRVREMLLNAARHAHLPGELTWSGFRWPCAEGSALAVNSADRSRPHDTRSALMPGDSEGRPDQSSTQSWLYIMEGTVRRFIPPSYRLVVATLSSRSADEKASASWCPNDTRQSEGKEFGRNRVQA
ncbi:MAG: hypothetical protein NZM42_00290 [Gemmatales bacterium]|nr:hypothetical protein [Gemmatales bacterium]MDW8221765.1 hypothetical protein [Gemmatales bacterium]